MQTSLTLKKNNINHKTSFSTINQRPSSANQRYPFINKTQSLKQSYKVIYSNPNNQKQFKGMGKTIDKEELYENNIQLKNLVNNLKKTLDESKSIIIQKDIEIKKKNKIIENYLRDNDINEVHKENLKKGKESNLLSLIKDKYSEMKNNYNKKLKENEILRANIKITKIKEISIENDILKNEIEKYKKLFLNSQREIQNSNLEIDNLKEFKNKFLEQHLIINSLKKQNEELNLNIKNLKNEILQIKENLKKKNSKTKKIKLANSQLKISNDKYLNEKKLKEYQIMNQTDNNIKINKIQKQLNEYKNLYEQASREIQTLKKLEIAKNKNKENDQNIYLIKPMDKNIYKSINDNPNKENEKIILLKSLLKNSEIKNNIYENFLTKHNFKINKILEEGGYQNGIINQKSPNQKNKNIESSKSSSSKSKNDNFFITNNPNYDNQSNINLNDNKSEIKSTFNDGKSSDMVSIGYFNNIESKVTGFPSNNNFINQDIVKNENNDIKYYNNFNAIVEVDEDFIKNIPHLIKKNLECYNVNSNYLKNEVDKIKIGFQNKNQITKDDFIKPFIDLLMNSMKSNLESDVDLIKNYLEEKVDEFKDEIDKFYEHIEIIFDSISDYSNINEEEFLNNIKNDLLKYSPELLNKLYEHDLKKDHIITFGAFNNIIDKLNIEFNNDDDLEFLIYKMKISVPENHSIIDLNYSIIENLLNDKENDIPNNFLEESNDNINSQNNYNNFYNNNSFNKRNGTDNNNINNNNITNFNKRINSRDIKQRSNIQEEQILDKIIYPSSNKTH